MLIKYRFSINGRAVSPIYKDDISKDYALESQQRFYRAELSGKLKFIRSDFDWIDAQPFETEFVMLLEKSNDNGLTWVNYFTGVFYKTDCQIDIDSKIIEVSVETLDGYNEVLAGIDNEYDLIKLATAKTALTIQKRPLIQIYVMGEDTVACFLSGNAWEQDVNAATTNTTYLAECGFTKVSDVYRWQVTGTGVAPTEVLGDFVAKNMSYENFPAGGSYPLGGFKISTYGRNYDYRIEALSYQIEMMGVIYNDLKLIRTSDDVVLFQNLRVSEGDYSTFPENVNLAAVSGSGASGTVALYAPRESFSATAFKPLKIYARYLLDAETIQGSPTILLPTTDLVADNRNYSRAVGYGIDCTYISNLASVAPSQYGKADDGMYFLPPYDPTGQRYYPVCRSQWGNSSLWFAFNTFDWVTEQAGRKSYELKDASMLSDVIKSLLAQIDPSISHDATTEYSQFLYGSTNPIVPQVFRLMLTPKSNVLVGEYDQPAQKAPIALQSVMTMLRDTFQLYWYIDAGKFKIEHVSWFKNGGSYTTTPVYAIDLTTSLQQRNGKPWAFASNKYSYDKIDMPERYEFAWMDDVTEGFEGVPIKINSKYVQRGKKESINISQFTSDIDYMLLNPDEINKDGFALFAAILDTTNLFNINDPDVAHDAYIGYQDGLLQTLVGWHVTGYIPVEPGKVYWASYIQQYAFFDANKVYISGRPNGVPIEVPLGAKYIRYSVANSAWAGFRFIRGRYSTGEYYILPYVHANVAGAELRMQNGYLSYRYLHPNFWVYDLPSRNATINDSYVMYMPMIDRKKKQKVSFPMLEDPNPLQLIKTGLGSGQIEKISVNLSSRKIDAELKHNTE